MVISPTFLKVYALHPRLVSPPTGVLRFPMANWLSTIWSSHQPWNVGITRKTRVFHQRSTKICCSFAVKRCTRTFRKHVAGISDLWSYSRPGNLTKVVFWSWYIYIYIYLSIYIYINRVTPLNFWLWKNTNHLECWIWTTEIDWTCLNIWHPRLWLVGGGYLPLWKMMEWKSVGIMTFPIYMDSHKIPWFQTTKQLMINHDDFFSFQQFSLLTQPWHGCILNIFPHHCAWWKGGCNRLEMMTGTQPCMITWSRNNG